MGAKPRLVKKYANRRLYDQEKSAYITLDDLKQYINAGIPFKIIDSKTKEDVTRLCLIQIILELETSIPVFTTEALEQIIRLHGQPMQQTLTHFFEDSLKLFAEQQKHIQEQLEQTIKEDPLKSFSELTQKNLSIWQSLWKTPNDT